MGVTIGGGFPMAIDIDAEYLLVESLRRENKPFEAIESLRELIQGTELNSRVDFSFCQSFFLAVEALEHKNRQEIGKSAFSASNIKELGFHYVGDLNFEIKDYFKKLVTNAPNISEAHTFLGACYSSQNQFELAERHYKHAYKLDNRQDRAYTSRLCDPHFDVITEKTVDDMARKLPDVHFGEDNFHPNQPVVFISCDYSYFLTFATTLINSIRHNSPGINLHIHLMNPNVGLAKVRSYVSRIKGLIDEIDNLKINFSYEIINPSPTKKNFLQCYYASARLFRLYQFMLRYNSPIMNLDVDGLILKHLGSVFQYVEGYDIGVRIRPGRFEPWNQIDAAGFIINPTEAGIKYLELVAKYVGAFALEEKSSWMLDQMSLFSTMEFFRRHHCIYVKPLEDKMLGNQETPYSVVWKTAGRGKFDQAKQVHEGCSEELLGDNYTKLFRQYKDLYDSPSVVLEFNEALEH